MTSASPSGSTSGPGSRSPAESSINRPQPNESAARTSGKTTQATSRARALSDRRDASRCHEAQRPLRGGVEHLDLLVGAWKRDVDVRRSVRRIDRDAAPWGRDTLLVGLLSKVPQDFQGVWGRVRADDRVVGALVADLYARREIADVDASAGRPGQFVGVTRARADPVDRGPGLRRDGAQSARGGGDRTD